MKKPIDAAGKVAGGPFVSFGSVCEGRNNYVNEIRLLAAYLVIFSHSWSLFGSSTSEPFFALTNHRLGGGGTIAVTIFFVLSGTLIYRSASTSSPLEFAIFRALRIVPGALVCALFCILVVGPMATTLDLRDYLFDIQTWSFLKNGVPILIQEGLPGVFKSLPFPNAVNGSLWTLPIEIFLYATCAIIVYCLKSRHLPAVAMAGIAALAWMGWLNSSAKVNVANCGWYFFSGAALFVYRDLVPMSHRLASMALAFLLIATPVISFPLASAIALPYLVIWCGYAWKKPRQDQQRRDRPDISYGVYLYGFPVQQLATYFFLPTLPFASLMLISLAAATALALASWYLIEKPALAYKRSFVSRVAPGLA